MKNKKLAILLACTLGGFGAHRFYLGQPKYGWFYLGFSWTLIPLLIGIIDAICFTSMSYATFNRKYTLKHMLSKKFEDDEALLIASFEAKREKELLKKIEQMQNKELIKLFLDQSKQQGNYLPRTVYARAKAILEDRPWKFENTLD